jgi:hypothetical protein
MASRDPLKAGLAATEHLAFCLARAIETLSSIVEPRASSSPLFRRRRRRQPSADSQRQTR